MGGAKRGTKTKTTTRSLLQRPLDLVFVCFFVTHVPTSLAVDAQCLVPAEYFPEPLRLLLDYHVATFKDPLMGTCPPWLRAVIFCELAFQVPFFLVATYAFCRGRNWIRIPSLIYGTHTSTTLVPILGSFWLGDESKGAPPLSLAEKWTLTGIYIPYLILPLLLVLRMLPTDKPFDAVADESSRKSKTW